MIPCDSNQDLSGFIAEFSEILRTKAHTLVPDFYGLTEDEFYAGVFRGAIERLRGQFSATMGEKRDFAKRVLNHLQDQSFIKDWESAGDQNRHDYNVTMQSGKVACIELKGCLDGNNTNIFERPAHAQEFVIWSICSNPASNPRHNVWSGIHTRLSAEIIEHQKQVDGLIVWDWFCGSKSRPCPKLTGGAVGAVTLGPHQLPPPCIYLFPKTVPSVRNNPDPDPHQLEDVEFLDAMHKCFGGTDDLLNFVRFQVGHSGGDTVRTTKIFRGTVLAVESKPTPIRRR